MLEILLFNEWFWLCIVTWIGTSIYGCYKIHSTPGDGFSEAYYEIHKCLAKWGFKFLTYGLVYLGGCFGVYYGLEGIAYAALSIMSFIMLIFLVVSGEDKFFN